ncbi:helix-turn-helix domain-containing protein [Deltaproteobacteria bacterium TL4]
MKEKRTIAVKNFQYRLKQLRQSKGWSQGQLAVKLGMDNQRISKYERGVMFPTVDIMIKLARSLEVSLDYLLCGEQEISLEKIPNRELVKRFDQVSRLSNEEQKAVMMVMDSFIKSHRMEEVMQG